MAAVSYTHLDVYKRQPEQNEQDDTNQSGQSNEDLINQLEKQIGELDAQIASLQGSPSGKGRDHPSRRAPHHKLFFRISTQPFSEPYKISSESERRAPIVQAENNTIINKDKDLYFIIGRLLLIVQSK